MAAAGSILDSRRVAVRGLYGQRFRERALVQVATGLSVERTDAMDPGSVLHAYSSDGAETKSGTKLEHRRWRCYMWITADPAGGCDGQPIGSAPGSGLAGNSSRYLKGSVIQEILPMAGGDRSGERRWQEA